jgi:hypothetical protein
MILTGVATAEAVVIETLELGSDLRWSMRAAKSRSRRKSAPGPNFLEPKGEDTRTLGTEGRMK